MTFLFGVQFSKFQRMMVMDVNLSRSLLFTARQEGEGEKERERERERDIARIG